MKNKIAIRLATKDDISFLSDLINDLGYLTTSEEMQKRFENIHNHSDYKTFVASIGNRIVGMAGATQNYSFEQNGKYVRIVAFVINSLFRQKGIGKKLLQAVEDWAKEIGATSVLYLIVETERTKTST